MNARKIKALGGGYAYACRTCGVSTRSRSKAQDCCANVVPLFDAAPPPPGMRTQEQIIEQLEARYAEIEAEATRRSIDPDIQFKCTDCRWRRGFWCKQPLVIGLDHPDTLNRDYYRETYGSGDHYNNRLCGPEKALWEAKPKQPMLIERFLEWLAGFFS